MGEGGGGVGGQDIGRFQHPISVASGAKSPLFSRRHIVHTAARGVRGVEWGGGEGWSTAHWECSPRHLPVSGHIGIRLINYWCVSNS